MPGPNADGARSPGAPRTMREGYHRLEVDAFLDSTSALFLDLEQGRPVDLAAAAHRCADARFALTTGPEGEVYDRDEVDGMLTALADTFRRIDAGSSVEEAVKAMAGTTPGGLGPDEAAGGPPPTWDGGTSDLTAYSILHGHIPTTSSGEGYDRFEVDELLDKVHDFLVAHEDGIPIDAALAAEYCATARFLPRKPRKPREDSVYRRNEVDALLAALTEKFRAIAATTPSATTPSAPGRYVPPGLVMPGSAPRGTPRPPGGTGTMTAAPDLAESTRPPLLAALLVSLTVIAVVVLGVVLLG